MYKTNQCISSNADKQSEAKQHVNTEVHYRSIVPSIISIRCHGVSKHSACNSPPVYVH